MILNEVSIYVVFFLEIVFLLFHIIVCFANIILVSVHVRKGGLLTSCVRGPYVSIYVWMYVCVQYVKNSLKSLFLEFFSDCFNLVGCVTQVLCHLKSTFMLIGTKVLGPTCEKVGFRHLVSGARMWVYMCECMCVCSM